MQVKKLLAFCLALLMVVAMVSCAGENTPNTPSEDTSDTQADSPVFVPTVLDLSVAGESNFSIIYPQGAEESILQIAMRFQEAFSTYTGASVAVKSDIKLDENENTDEAYEICIGNTNRRESTEVLRLVEGSNDYAVAVCGNKLVIAGNSVSATVNGVYYFINKVLSAADIQNGNYRISSEQNYYYKAVYPVQNFHILGNSAKEYQIVIPKDASFAVERFALRLRYLIATRTGVSLAITDDSSAGEYEILVGQTVRTTSSVGDNEYALTAKENRVEILADGLYGYEYLYNYCSNKLCGLLKDGTADSGELYRKNVTEEIRADQIESVLNKQGELRFMQFNILGEDSHHPFALASRMVAAMVEELNPDIFAVEEYYLVAQKSENYPLEESLAALGYGMADGNQTIDGVHKPATPIFYRTDVWELVTQDSYNPTKGHTGKWTTSCVLKRKTDSKQIAIVNCHLDHYTTAEGDALRVVQIKEAIATANDLQTRYACDVLLTGDLNSKMDGGAYATLIQRGFVNTRELATVTDNHTTAWRDDPVYNENAGVLEHPKETAENFVATAIDHTMYLGNGLTFNRFDVLTDPCSLSVSDHAPTVIDFDLKGYVAPEPPEPWTDTWTKNY